MYVLYNLGIVNPFSAGHTIQGKMLALSIKNKNKFKKPTLSCSLVRYLKTNLQTGTSEILYFHYF